jgi:hypothetical protein
MRPGDQLAGKPSIRTFPSPEFSSFVLWHAVQYWPETPFRFGGGPLENAVSERLHARMHTMRHTALVVFKISSKVMWGWES